jgi:hypothetical protein
LPLPGPRIFGASVRVFATQVIPGLLRSPGYATAVWQAATPSLDPKLLDRFLAVTRHRQELLKDEDFNLHAVLDETALRRPISTADAMTAHLAESTANANITLQVLPLTTPWPVLSHPFALLAYRDPAGKAAPDIAATSPAPGHVTITRHAARARTLNTAFDKLTAAALSRADSARLACLVRLTLDIIEAQSPRNGG